VFRGEIAPPRKKKKRNDPEYKNDPLQNPIEPPPWNDVAEHVPDSRIDGYKPTYWPFVKAVADKPPPPPTTYRQTGSVYVPVFDVADFGGRSPWHAPPHRLAPENDDHEDYYVSPASLNAYRVDNEPKAAVRMLAAAAANVFGGLLLPYRPSDDDATPRNDGAPPPAAPETFDGQSAVIVLAVPVETAASENATAAAAADDDDDASLLLLVVDRELENVAELRQTDARPPAHLTVDNISAEFPSDDGSPTVDNADRKSAYAVNEYDNDVA